MIDWVILLAPVLLAPITLLLVFLGCGLGTTGTGPASILTFTLKDQSQNPPTSVTVDGGSNGTINVNPGDMLFASVTTNFNFGSPPPQ